MKETAKKKRSETFGKVWFSRNADEEQDIVSNL
jgi:hypothetical protein